MDILFFLTAGFAGTTALILVMGTIHLLGLANSNMVEAVGSLITKTTKNSFVPGLIIEYIGGFIFVAVYAAILNMAPVQTLASTLFLSTILGLAHGTIVGMVLSIALSTFHPIEKYRNAGPEVAAAHVAGHVVYGFFVGLVLGATQLNGKNGFQATIANVPLFDELSLITCLALTFGLFLLPLFYFAWMYGTRKRLN